MRSGRVSSMALSFRRLSSGTSSALRVMVDLFRLTGLTDGDGFAGGPRLYPPLSPIPDLTARWSGDIFGGGFCRLCQSPDTTSQLPEAYIGGFLMVNHPPTKSALTTSKRCCSSPHLPSFLVLTPSAWRRASTWCPPGKPRSLKVFFYRI